MTLMPSSYLTLMAMCGLNYLSASSTWIRIPARLGFFISAFKHLNPTRIKTLSWTRSLSPTQTKKRTRPTVCIRLPLSHDTPHYHIPAPRSNLAKDLMLLLSSLSCACSHHNAKSSYSQANTYHGNLAFPLM